MEYAIPLSIGIASPAKPLNFLMGQLMKRTQGRADPDTARRILVKQLDA